MIVEKAVKRQGNAVTMKGSDRSRKCCGKTVERQCEVTEWQRNSSKKAAQSLHVAVSPQSPAEQQPATPASPDSGGSALSEWLRKQCDHPAQGLEPVPW